MLDIVNFHPTRKRSSGFTIIEVLVYVAIFASMMSFVLSAFFRIIKSSEFNEDRVSVERESDFVMRKFAWVLSGASTINEPASGATSSRLSVDRYNFTDNPVVMELSEGVVTMSRGGGTPIRITSDKVSAEYLEFLHISPSISQREGIEINVTFVSSSTNDQNVNASTTLTNTIHIRR